MHEFSNRPRTPLHPRCRRRHLPGNFQDSGGSRQDTAAVARGRRRPRRPDARRKHWKNEFETSFNKYSSTERRRRRHRRRGRTMNEPIVVTLLTPLAGRPRDDNGRWGLTYLLCSFSLTLLLPAGDSGKRQQKSDGDHCSNGSAGVRPRHGGGPTQKTPSKVKP